jgi:hypothetical protein
MSEGRMTKVVRQRDRLTQRFSRSERPRHATSNLCNLNNVVKTSAKCRWPRRVNDALHLGFVLKFAERLAVNDSVAVYVV